MNRTRQQVVQEEFLLARAKILELAAIFDRIDRGSTDAAAGTEFDDRIRQQLSLLSQGIAILQEEEAHRARRVQKLMSRPYDPQWREQWTI